VALPVDVVDVLPLVAAVPDGAAVPVLEPVLPVDELVEEIVVIQARTADR
jgi:hypothetical protein